MEAGSGSLGAASSESAAGSGRFRACPADVEPATVSAVAWSCGCVDCRWVWMVVRFVCVFRVPECARVSRACPVCVPAPPGVFFPVKRHRGEPGHTRDRHKNLTNQPQNQPHPPTHAPDHTRTPGHTRRPTPHHSPSPASAVVVTVMATAPGRGSSEGASPTASVTALLRVPGGTEVPVRRNYIPHQGAPPGQVPCR